MPLNKKDSTDADDILSALDFLTKAEGSRGGHVIGHTRSGKPIYAQTKADHPNYRKFTRQDHEDAQARHKDQVEHTRWMMGYGSGDNSKEWEERDRQQAAADSHWDAARSMPTDEEISQLKSLRKPTKIGVTPSGKSIFSGGTPKAATNSHPIHRSARLRNQIQGDTEAILDPANHVHGDTARTPVLKLADKHFPDWSSQDHFAASKAHEGQMQRHFTNSKHEEGPELSVGSDHHAAAQFHNMAGHYLKDMKKSTRPSAGAILAALEVLTKAEGARGGHIIGHSKSGKPIYAAKGNKRELLHKLGRGENHVAVAASLKHGHYIGMFGADHFKRADRHDQKAAAHFAKAKKADSAKSALKMQKMGQAHADLGRAHRMMGQLSSDVRMPDHIREAAAMHTSGTHDKDKLKATKERYFAGLGLAGHQRALSRHGRLHAAAAEAGQKATAEHHDTMANTHRAILHTWYNQPQGA